ncbi:MAG TPA: hypothetical protein VER17_12420 [Tepidisphaeraceae bacterium]|nr:hypothetical protein [Tepidisphaeraceae bacterium]
METMESRFMLSTYTVTNTNDSGAGSLRQAILDANKTTAADTINFKIGSGSKTIAPKSKLPGVEQTATIDATTQPGFSGKPLIEISGAGAGSSDGLKLIGSGITVKGLIINRFKGSGIFVYNKGGAKITGNWIGVDSSGTGDAGNGAHGIIVQSPNNTIGGTTAAERNVISGNTKAGVFLYNGSAHHNKIQGNYCGTDYTGSKAIANHNGVQINGGADNLVGGTTAGARNVCSGNIHDGVLIVSYGSKNNTVQGNYLGTDATGTRAVGNGWYGVEISQPNNLVGGTAPGAGNVISANKMDGVALYTATGINNRVEGNYIGTDCTGTKDLGNVGAGVAITNDAKYNTVGGTSAAAANVISGNDLYGVGIYNHSTNNTIVGNKIGLCAKGYSLPNGKNAVSIWISTNNAIKNNKIVQGTGARTTILVSSGLTTSITGNNIYNQISVGLKVA